MAKKLTQEEVLKRFRERWGDKYDYSKVNYINRRTYVTIGCREHGDFTMLPLTHANGHGCKKCGNKSQAQKLAKPKKNKQWLLSRLYGIYGMETFDFSQVEKDSFVYKGVKTRIPVVCKVCGTLAEPMASWLLRGTGCNTCRIKKFSKSQLGKAKPVSKRKLVAGVGVTDIEGVVKYEKPYSIWREMIIRCYDHSRWMKRPTYKKCEVCDEWKLYSNYVAWYNANQIDGFDVDKDLLSYYNGKKVYSPQTCCFLPPEINNVLSSKKQKKRKYPLGVNIIDGCITATCGSHNYLGTFSTVEDAHKAYLIAKKERINELANKWKDKLTPKVYDALINLDVDIFFNN